MNCREFQNQFEVNIALDSVAQQHLDSCTECGAFQFEQTRVSELLGGLHRVEAPNDFDFKLKARIASGEPSKVANGVFPAWRFVFPLALVIAVISVAALSGLYLAGFSANQSVSVNEIAPIEDYKIDETENAIPEVSQKGSGSMPSETADKTLAPAEKDVRKEKPEVAENVRINKVKLAKRDPVSGPENEFDGGSKDSALSSQPPIIQPEFDQNRSVLTSPDPQNTRTVKLSDGWEMIGIEVVSGKIISIGSGSVAERSGLRVGDIIDEVNGEKLASNAMGGKKIEVRILTIIRNGISQEIAVVHK